MDADMTNPANAAAPSGINQASDVSQSSTHTASLEDVIMANGDDLYITAASHLQTNLRTPALLSGNPSLVPTELAGSAPPSIQPFIFNVDVSPNPSICTGNTIASSTTCPSSCPAADPALRPLMSLPWGPDMTPTPAQSMVGQTLLTFNKVATTTDKNPKNKVTGENATNSSLNDKVADKKATDGNPTADENASDGNLKDKAAGKKAVTNKTGKEKGKDSNSGRTDDCDGNSDLRANTPPTGMHLHSTSDRPIISPSAPPVASTSNIASTSSTPSLLSHLTHYPATDPPGRRHARSAQTMVTSINKEVVKSGNETILNSWSSCVVSVSPQPLLLSTMVLFPTTTPKPYISHSALLRWLLNSAVSGTNMHPLVITSTISLPASETPHPLCVCPLHSKSVLRCSCFSSTSTFEYPSSLLFDHGSRSFGSFEFHSLPSSASSLEHPSSLPPVHGCHSLQHSKSDTYLSPSVVFPSDTTVLPAVMNNAASSPSPVSPSHTTVLPAVMNDVTLPFPACINASTNACLPTNCTVGSELSSSSLPTCTSTEHNCTSTAHNSEHRPLPNFSSSAQNDEHHPFTLNIRSWNLNGHYDGNSSHPDFSKFFEGIDVFFIQETHCHADGDSIPTPSGFTLYTCNHVRSDLASPWGGVATLVSMPITLLMNSYVLPHCSRLDWHDWTNTDPFKLLCSKIHLAHEQGYPLIAIGDLNACTGISCASPDHPVHISLDSKSDNHGKRLLECLGACNTVILNGAEGIPGHHFTPTEHHNTGTNDHGNTNYHSSVIDYALASYECSPFITNFSISDCTD
ncbi:hypothetical protein D9758_013839 [Tetrapyrgos nigripes]|uniref:Endonuclease/exonuclease/phosphatase domain-containing protein n=1 Tax=Tetrapyrgos nigripes TaxID=182062 RepID=A0A8H5CTW1_9AGAR|nr:hypothetical protein D9758_013839 [Tetrapyrgos nigripes]